MLDIWNEKNPLAEYVYKLDNYFIENTKSEENICAIYFSSNNIWFPNTEKAFKKSFIENDYYEWKNFKYEKARKHIFIRDIYKSWYVEGINIRCNSVDKLLEFLKSETQGMGIITIGSSAGGYAAVLFGAILKAQYTLCFSAQFNLFLGGNIDKNPFLKKNLDNPQKVNYYDIVPFLKQSLTPIFYFVPFYAKQDLPQIKYVKSLSNVYVFKMRSRHHGVPILKCMLKNLINLTYTDLLKIHNETSEKIISQIAFSVKFVGICSTFKFIFIETLKQIKRGMTGE